MWFLALLAFTFLLTLHRRQTVTLKRLPCRERRETHSSKGFPAVNGEKSIRGECPAGVSAQPPCAKLIEKK
ncbi:hypothetical protein HMPREF9141_0754 [Prevotella multiformis DSM 16608]|uniref:Uncharacterized protein n=1 Tax=Prevotella multiformis DSM 16608 TaxID=888743 RepID=F0F588_9BACT|nr:hypothetical protein HMPREF9141_0754 [Prevotella multiformis DSM 16608]